MGKIAVAVFFKMESGWIRTIDLQYPFVCKNRCLRLLQVFSYILTLIPLQPHSPHYHKTPVYLLESESRANFAVCVFLVSLFNSSNLVKVFLCCKRLMKFGIRYFLDRLKNRSGRNRTCDPMEEILWHTTHTNTG